MQTPEKAVVQKMFDAFSKQDLEGAVATVTPDSVWIHHGTTKLPAIRFEGKDNVRQFFHVNFTTMKTEYFRVKKLLQDGNTVIAFGEEKFTTTGKEGHMAQQWVQVYTIKDGLIATMDEYATSFEAPEYIVVK